MQWKRITELALAITVVAGVGAGVVLWDAWVCVAKEHYAELGITSRCYQNPIKKIKLLGQREVFLLVETVGFCADALAGPVRSA